jgi:hypothetical protein
MEALAPFAPESAPRDGRVVRGYFLGEDGCALFQAVSWDAEREAWLTLAGDPIGVGLQLAAWGKD